MTTSAESPLRLVIVDDSAENAEALVSTLRNNGIVVRPQRPTGLPELSALLSTQPVDLVLSSQSSQDIPPELVIQAVIASGKDLPAILVVERLEEEVLVHARESGFRDLILRKRTDHLIPVIRKEILDLRARRGLRRVEAQMRDTDRRCDALIASSRDPIAYIHEGMHIRVNDAYLDMFAVDAFEDVEGTSLLDMVSSPSVPELKALLKALGKGEPPPPAPLALDVMRHDGQLLSATLTFSSASYEGESCLQVVFRQQQENDPQLARQVEEMRQRDLATGLLNRATLMGHLDQALDALTRSDRKFIFLLVSPDHAHRLVPEIGLESADVLAAAMANLLQKTVGDSAHVARLGEWSFAVLAEADWRSANMLADTIVTAFANEVLVVNDRSLTVTASIGGVLISERIASPSQILQRATDCLQSATGLGGNTQQIHDPSAVDRAEQERAQRWLQRLREAIAADDFVLHYQPVLNLLGESIERYDAFVRLKNEGQLVSPSSFIDIAGEHGLLADINRCVARLAIRRMGERKRLGHATHVGIRITPETFDDPAFIATIREELDVEGVPGSQLHLQIAESKVYTHLQAAQQFQQDMATLGCSLVLDQFGSGLDSFQLLNHFKPSYIKLDRTFTADFATLRELQGKVEEITRRATEMGITTIAEFVLDAPSMSLLFSAGVTFVQGDFVGQAQDAMDYDFG